MSLTVRIEPEAEVQIAALADWWRAHRTAARSLKALLADALEWIASTPYGAPVYARIEGEEVRRWPIKTTPYMVYYYVDEATHEAKVVSVWSAVRGEPPPLRVR